MDYVWNGALGRYQEATGRRRMVARRTVRKHLKSSLQASKDVIDTIADMWDAGTISSDDWRLAMREELKLVYTVQYMRGRGGRGRMTPADWGRIGGMLKEQYGYLDAFAEQVAAGSLTVGQIKVRNGEMIGVFGDERGHHDHNETTNDPVELDRSRMYSNSAREAYERALGIVARDTGSTHEKWTLGATEQSCPDCIALSKMGWVSIGTIDQVPGDGKTRCLTNCDCHKRYK